MKRYAIVVENGGTSLAAYVPDLPGCVATAETKEEVEQLIREAIERGRPCRLRFRARVNLPDLHAPG